MPDINPDLRAALDNLLLSRGHLRVFVPVQARDATLTMPAAIALLGNEGPGLAAWCAWAAVERVDSAWTAWLAEHEPAPAGGHSVDRV